MPRDKDDLSGLRRKRDRGRRLRTAVLSIISVVLVALLIGGLFLALDGRDTRIRLAFFNQDTVKQTLTARGLIVREEMQLLAPGSGLLLPLYSSGSRISKLDQVATVFLPGHEDSADRLHNLQRQIYHRQAELIRTDFTQPQVQKARELGRAEIAKTLTSARLAAGDAHELLRERERQRHDEGDQDQRDDDGVSERQIRVASPVLAAPSGDDRRDPGVERHEHAQ